MLEIRCLLLTAAVLLATPVARAQNYGSYSSISNVSSSDCPADGGAHVIVARASEEPLGYGIIGMVKDALVSAIPASNAEFVVYPATLTDYFDSESAGVLGMKALAEAYVTKDCPGAAPIVLMGYSQGAQVVADYLSGQNVLRFPPNRTLARPASDAVLSRLAAVITMGDPSITVRDNPAHVGNATLSGIFARLENSSAVFHTSGINSKLQAYCDALDPYCASAGNFDHLPVHLNYVPEYGMEAAEFVERKVREYYARSTGGSPATAATNSGTPAASTGAAPGRKITRPGSAVAVVLALGIALVPTRW